MNELPTVMVYAPNGEQLEGTLISCDIDTGMITILSNGRLYEFSEFDCEIED